VYRRGGVCFCACKFFGPQPLNRTDRKPDRQTMSIPATIEIVYPSNRNGCEQGAVRQRFRSMDAVDRAGSFGDKGITRELKVIEREIN
jgi:hypothetical protein